MVKNKTLKNKKSIINLFSFWHFGDAIFVMIYLYNSKDYIIKHNISVNFYIKEKYVNQIKEFECCKNVRVLPIIFDKDCNQNIFSGSLKRFNNVLLDFNLCNTNIPKNSINTYHGFHSLIHYFLLDLNMFKWNENIKPFNEYLVYYLSNILGKKIGFPKIKKFSYTDPDLLKRYNNFQEKYKNIDILIINSEPQSQQYDLESNRKNFNSMIHTLSKKFNIVTTEKVKGILCTRDNNLSLKDIGAISTHAKYIIAINTGPLIGCLNSYAFKNVKKWFEFDMNMPFIYKNFVINPTFEEIINEIDG